MERVELTFVLRDDIHIPTPRAETPASRLTLGFHENLNQATLVALNAMLDWMMELYRINRADAQALASLLVDLRITQIVNETRGVHAVLPREAIPRLSAL